MNANKYPPVIGLIITAVCVVSILWIAIASTITKEKQVEIGNLQYSLVLSHIKRMSFFITNSSGING